MPPLLLPNRKIREGGFIVDSCWGGRNSFWDRFTFFLDRERFEYYFRIHI